MSKNSSFTVKFKEVIMEAKEIPSKHICFIVTVIVMGLVLFALIWQNPIAEIIVALK